MPSIDLDITYFSHPKTTQLVASLGRGSEALPIRLWCYAAMHFAEDGGRLTGLDERAIEGAVYWRGDSGKMILEMMRVGFLEQDDDGTYRVHNFEARQGHIRAYKVRATTAARARWDRAAGSEVMPQASPSSAQASPKQCSSNACAMPLPNPTALSPPDPSGAGLGGAGPNGAGLRAGRARAAPTGAAGEPPLPESGSDLGGIGSGSGAAAPRGNLAGTLGRVARTVGVQAEGDDGERMLQVQSRLSALAVNAEVQKELMIRRDVTPERIDAEVRAIQQGGKVDSVAAVLVKRLRQPQVKRAARK